jgi:hypothetical protein
MLNSTYTRVVLYASIKGRYYRKEKNGKTMYPLQNINKSLLLLGHR